MTRSSQARTEIDRRDDYFAKPEHRKRDDFARQVLRGAQLQTALRERWAAKPAVRTNPDDYMQGEA